MANAITLNSISAVRLKDAVRDDATGAMIPLIFYRNSVPQNLVTHLKDRLGHGSPQHSRQPSALLPPGDAVLELSLSEALGSGHMGTVFAVDIISNSSHLYVPPLAIKVCRQGKAQFLAREAWFYEEMESIQGVALARCFGWFEADPGDYSHWTLDNPALTAACSPANPNKTNTDMYLTEPWRSTFGEFNHSSLVGTCKKGGISFLLLERLGNHLPCIPGNEVPEETRKELKELWNELGHFGIQHMDIRISNVLAAPTSPPGLSGIPSRWTNRMYKWRLVDFELSRKINRPTEWFFDDYDMVTNDLYNAMFYGSTAVGMFTDSD